MADFKINVVNNTQKFDVNLSTEDETVTTNYIRNANVDIDTNINVPKVNVDISETNPVNVDILPAISGPPGPPGEKGEDGYTPIKGVDYFDGDPGEKGDPGDQQVHIGQEKLSTYPGYDYLWYKKDPNGKIIDIRHVRRVD